MPMKPFIPTEADKERVIDLAGKGFNSEEISHYIFKEDGTHVSGKTILRKFKKELAFGKIKTDNLVASVMQEMATSGENTKATMFWLESRRKWNKENDVGLSGEITIKLPSIIKDKNV